MTTINDLVTWLREQLDDDERVARTAASYSAERGYSFPTDDSGTYGMLAYEHEQHAARHDPARVLAEVDAKRRILDRCEYELRTYVGPSSQVALAYLVLKSFALPYAGRPGYREEWGT